MGLRYLICFCLLINSVWAEKGTEANQILFLMHSGEMATAFERYDQYTQQLGHHDLELIQRIGLTLLEQGSRSEDPEIQLLAIYGAGIALNEGALHILEQGIDSPMPQMQLVCMNMLNRYHDDKADQALVKAMTAKHPLIRLEAIYLMAEKKHPKAVHHAESLMSRASDDLIPLFPQIFCAAGTADAMRILRRLLAHESPEVRLAAIQSVIDRERDDMLPQIRMLLSQHDPRQQEACATAIGLLHDESSVKRLEILADSNASNTRLAALLALYRLGRKETRKDIELMAREGDSFAVTSLGEIPDTEDTLFELTKSLDLTLRINATIALLERQDPRCVPSLRDVLVHDVRDLAFIRNSSPGKSLTSCKVLGSAQQKFADTPAALEISLKLRETVLRKTVDLPEENFLQLADALFELQQNELVPTLVELLETLHTPAALALLKKHQQKAGAPLVRNYCNLALYRLKEQGPYEQNVKNWILQQHDTELIRFRPYVPREIGVEDSVYQLTPQETSRLLIETVEALAQTHNDGAIDVLMHAIRNGNTNNKYALAGLLMRLTQ